MRFALIVPAVILAGCVAEEPMVNSYNGHTVTVVSHPYPLGERWRESPTYAKAVEACGRDAVYQGTRQINQFQGEHVYICR